MIQKTAFCWSHGTLSFQKKNYKKTVLYLDSFWSQAFHKNFSHKHEVEWYHYDPNQRSSLFNTQVNTSPKRVNVSPTRVNTNVTLVNTTLKQVLITKNRMNMASKGIEIQT